MVYVPILKIDLPEPRLQELLPGLVTAVLGACTLAFDAVYDFLQPLPPEGQDLLYAATITHLPKEFRRARRRIVELGIRDEDKVSEELETAAFNFYRCDPVSCHGSGILHLIIMGQQADICHDSIQSQCTVHAVNQQHSIPTFVCAWNAVGTAACITWPALASKSLCHSVGCHIL